MPTRRSRARVSSTTSGPSTCRGKFIRVAAMTASDAFPAARKARVSRSPRASSIALDAKAETDVVKSRVRPPVTSLIVGVSESPGTRRARGDDRRETHADQHRSEKAATIKAGNDHGHSPAVVADGAKIVDQLSQGIVREGRAAACYLKHQTRPRGRRPERRAAPGTIAAARTAARARMVKLSPAMEVASMAAFLAAATESHAAVSAAREYPL